MGYTITPTVYIQHVLRGVRIINGEPYMREDSEDLYVYGEFYYNPQTKEIKNHIPLEWR